MKRIKRYLTATKFLHHPFRIVLFSWSLLQLRPLKMLSLFWNLLGMYHCMYRPGCFTLHERGDAFVTIFISRVFCFIAAQLFTYIPEAEPCIQGRILEIAIGGYAPKFRNFWGGTPPPPLPTKNYWAGKNQDKNTKISSAYEPKNFAAPWAPQKNLVYPNFRFLLQF